MQLEEVDVKSPAKREIKLNTGISEKSRNEIAKHLKKMLADSYCLMLMSQNYHWNVRGMNFRNIHLMTEEHYTDLFDAIDELAERIRALGHLSPGTMKDFNDITSINIPNGDLSEQEMVADLLEGHEVVTRTARGALDAASDAKDEATVDLLTERLEFHEKTAWMLRSMLEQ